MPEGLSARFIERRDPALVEVLAAAACVVCVEPDDPGDAVAFARHGFGVVAPLSSGAHEYVRHVALLRGDHVREIYVAAMTAAGQPASVRPLAPPPVTPEKATSPVHAGELPLVTVITPTYNRRDDLPVMLKCLAAQTYPRIEAIVINDSGESIDDIVARSFPFARLLQTPTNMGSHNAVARHGLPAMQGEYVCFLADDDYFMPDHIERMVGAMLRSGMAIAHGNANIRFQEKNAKGDVVTTGSNVSIFTDTATPSEALVSTPIAGQALMFRVDAWNAFGGIRADSDLADQEMQLRAMLAYNFVYVDAVTCDWGVRGARGTCRAGRCPRWSCGGCTTNSTRFRRARKYAPSAGAPLHRRKPPQGQGRFRPDDPLVGGRLAKVFHSRGRYVIGERLAGFGAPKGRGASPAAPRRPTPGVGAARGAVRADAWDPAL